MKRLLITEVVTDTLSFNRRTEIENLYVKVNQNIVNCRLLLSIYISIRSFRGALVNGVLTSELGVYNRNRRSDSVPKKL